MGIDGLGVCCSLSLSHTHILRSFLRRPRKKKYRDQAGMDEEEDIDTRMFERREDRLTDKARFGGVFALFVLFCSCLGFGVMCDRLA